MQRGVIYRDRHLWMLKYNAKELRNGETVWVKRAAKLAAVCDQYRTVASVRPIAEEILAPFNRGTARPQSSDTVEQFIEHTYLPYCKRELRPSTHNGYAYIFRSVKPHLRGLRLRQFGAFEANRLLADIASGKDFSTTSLQHMRAFLTGAFSYAVRNELMTVNPMREARSPKGKRSPETHAYSIKEVEGMLAVLPEPARTVVLTAALTGLSRSELPGLRKDDLVGNDLYVRRAVWGTHIDDTKVRARTAPVPVLPVLRKALEQQIKRSASEYIFAGAKMGRPLNLPNLTKRMINGTLKEKGILWQGWHPFRRGLATNLYALGVQDKVIQQILRHSNVSTTQRHYIKTSSQDAQRGMKKLERLVTKFVTKRSPRTPKNNLLDRTITRANPSKHN